MGRFAESKANGRQLGVNAGPLRSIVGGSARIPATEAGVMAARGRGGRGACARAVRREIHGEDSEFAGYICVREGVLTPDADVALAIAKDGGAEELVPGGGSDGEGGDDDGAHPVCAGLGYKGVEEGGGGKAKRVSRCSRSQWGHREKAQSGTVKASSASAAGSA